MLCLLYLVTTTVALALVAGLPAVLCHPHPQHPAHVICSVNLGENRFFLPWTCTILGPVRAVLEPLGTVLATARVTGV